MICQAHHLTTKLLVNIVDTLPVREREAGVSGNLKQLIKKPSAGNSEFQEYLGSRSEVLLRPDDYRQWWTVISRAQV